MEADIVSFFAKQRGLQDLLQTEKLVLSDPLLFPEMGRAVDRIRSAIESGEIIGIFGDYDADGITGTAQLVRYFRRHGREPVVHLPHREKEGYGMKKPSIDLLHQKGVALLITVDTGITAKAEIEHAMSLGMDVIVTDHHSAPEGRPPAYAVIHPRIPSLYPNQHLSGSGVAFMLVRALEDGKAWPGIEQDVVLAAIGTVGDLVPLTGENRILVTRGLALVAKLQDCSLKLFFEQVKIDGACTAADLAYRIVPRINASGRMDHPLVALEALLGSEEALGKLHSLNTHRQAMTEASYILAEKLIDPSQLFLCIASDQFTAGIVGLVAGKLTEKYGRPSLAATIDKDGVCTASIRSIPQYDVMRALRDPRVRELLDHSGGHAQAAGCSFHVSKLPDLIERLQQCMSDAGIGSQDLVPSLSIDLELPSTMIDKAFVLNLQRLEPFGQHNQEPLFLLKGQRLEQLKAVGKDGTHLQCRLAGGPKIIGFRFGHLLQTLSAGDEVDLVFSVGIQRWNGREDVQLMLKDIRKSLAA